MTIGDLIVPHRPTPNPRATPPGNGHPASRFPSEQPSDRANPLVSEYACGTVSEGLVTRRTLREMGLSPGDNTGPVAILRCRLYAASSITPERHHRTRPPLETAGPKATSRNRGRRQLRQHRRSSGLRGGSRSGRRRELDGLLHSLLAQGARHPTALRATRQLVRPHDGLREVPHRGPRTPARCLLEHVQGRHR